MHMTYMFKPALKPWLRLTLAFVLAVAGIALQICVHWLLGCLAVFGGGMFLWARGFTNKPDDIGLEDWRPVTWKEIDRITENLAGSLTLRKQLPFLASMRGAFVFSGIFILLAFISLMAESEFMAVAWLDGLLFLAVPLFTGTVQIWIPRDLMLKMACVRWTLGYKRPDWLVITPYLRLDKDKESHQIPEDVRLLLERRDKAADMIGIQMQVAINNGPNGAVPYLYAVALTRGTGATYQKLGKTHFQGYVTEQQTSGEYGTVILRQDTSGTGYCTDESDCGRLLGLCLGLLEMTKA
jgi:hypothetical protein